MFFSEDLSENYNNPKEAVSQSKKKSNTKEKQDIRCLLRQPLLINIVKI
jgi:hypothetical protein